MTTSNSIPIRCYSGRQPQTRKNPLQSSPKLHQIPQRQNQEILPKTKGEIPYIQLLLDHLRPLIRSPRQLQSFHCKKIFFYLFLRQWHRELLLRSLRSSDSCSTRMFHLVLLRNRQISGRTARLQCFFFAICSWSFFDWYWFLANVRGNCVE